ncbi:MAG: TolC family protein [Acidobacteriota bacterium]|nr:TolC family protein [Acidobacteriota bacterium]
MRFRLSNAALLLLAGLITGPLPSAICAAQQQPPYRLTLQDAIQKALQANLSVLVAGTRVEEAEGTRMRRMSAALLPRVNAQTYANYQNRNLRAFGISVPGMPEVVGPFSNYDFRVYAQQNVVDLQSYRAYKASELALDAGKMDYEDARDLIVRAIAALYLDGQSAAARVDAAQSRVTASTALYKLAKDKHDAGTATGVDVLRAQVQLANDRQALLVDQNLYKQSLLALARNLGMSPGTPLELAQPLEFRPLSQPEIETLVAAALVTRADYVSLARQRQSLVEQQRANRARSYPKLSLNGNFGGIGRSIGGVQATGLIQGQIDFTLFDRDRDGEAQEIASRIQRIDDQVADLRRGIEEDIRAALLNLESAAEQVSVAGDGQNLAQRELEMTQDRFQAGTANNVEVVTAQDELARAQENYIVAVTNHVDAKFALARAMGDTEKNIVQFMGNP